MQATRVRCVLLVAGGPSRRVGPSGVLVGRQHDCDIVALDPSVSRRHALVRLTASGAELVPLGRAAIHVNGKPVTRPRALAHGDELRVPGLQLGVEIRVDAPDPRGASFVLVRGDGAAAATFGVAHAPFVIGGGDDDDLIIKKWPPRAIVLHEAQGELYIAAAAAGATKNGEPIAEGALERLAIGDALALAGESLGVARAPTGATTAVTSDELPRAIAIEMLPRGGRIALTFADGERAVYLADRRFDLVVALLRPPKGFKAGDAIPDDVVRAVVWPRKPGVSRNEINMLISRCRRDLVEAGLAGPRLVERVAGGGATRFALDPRAEITVKS